MKKMCTDLGRFVLILGIIGSIILAWNNGITVDYDSYHRVVEERRSLLLVIMWFAFGMFLTVIQSVVLNALGEILENQEYIIRKISESSSKVESLDKNKEKDEIKYNNSWKCPECGRLNASYIGTCACGKTK